MAFAVRSIAPNGEDRDRDIAGIKRLCVARSYMGKDIREVFSFSDLWASLVIDPYEQLSPEYIWVAEQEPTGEIVGYLTGAVRDDFYGLHDKAVSDLIDRLRNRGLLNLRTNPLQFWGNALDIVGGLDRRTIEFLQYLKTRAGGEVPGRPASPHFNIFAQHDGAGIARTLIDAFMETLRSMHETRYHITALYTPDDQQREMLEAEGFRVRSLEFFAPDYTLYDSLETSVFEPHRMMIGCFEGEVPPPAV